MRLIVFPALLFCLYAQAEMSIEAISQDGKKANIRLDNAKNYRIGDKVYFYKNRKLVSQGSITLITPKKTKAAVELTHGAPFQNNLLGYNTYLSKIEGRQRQVAQYAPKERRADRSPASINNIRMKAPSWGPNGSTRDLLYYPEEDSFLLNLEGIYSQGSIKIKNFSTIKYTESGFSPTLFYSPIKNLALGLGLAYQHVTNESGNTSDTASGISDPSVHINYQFMSVKDDDYQLALLTELSPSIGDSADNNVLRGNHLIRMGLLFGSKSGQFSWNIVPYLNYYTETKTDDGAGDMKAYYELIVQAELQYDLSQRWALYAPLMIRYTSDQDAKDDSYKFKSFISLGLGAGFKYAVSEPLNLYFVGRYEKSPSVTLETSSTSNDGDASLFTINLGANYSF